MNKKGRKMWDRRKGSRLRSAYKYHRIKTKYRYHLCGDAKHPDSIQARHHVDSRKSNKQLTRQRRRHRRRNDNVDDVEADGRLASKYRRYVPAKSHGLQHQSNMES